MLVSIRVNASACCASVNEILMRRRTRPQAAHGLGCRQSGCRPQTPARGSPGRKPLHLDDPERTHPLQVLGCLDTFCRGRHVQSRAEACDGLNDGGALLALAEALNERTIDLDVVEGKAAQVAQ